MISPPAVVVHGLDDAVLALRPGLPVTLLSGPGAALYAGEGWWRALVAAARKAVPGMEFQDILDCADAPGRAMAALRIGQKRLILAAASPAFPAVSAAAAALGGTVLGDRPPALDLSLPGATRRLDSWLRRPVG
jgi:hypothetical protein